MARTETNFTAFAGTFEDEDGNILASPTWFEVEANSDNITSGAVLSTVARNPISPDRQARKGVVTNLESSFGFSTDLTMQAMQDFLPAFVYARHPNSDLVWRAPATSSNAYTVGSLSAVQRGKLKWVTGSIQSLVYARGFDTDANNGLKALTAAPATNATTLAVSGLTAEANPPANATLEIAGIRGEFILEENSGIWTLVENDSNGFMDELGLVPGQWIHIGGPVAANQFPNGNYGFARVRDIASNELTLDKMDSRLSAAGARANVDILFGRYWRNVERSDATFMRPSIRFETTHPDLGDGEIGNEGQTLYQYSTGNFGNELTLNITPEQLITASMAFIGRDTLPETPTRENGASGAISPLANEGFNATNDVARIFLADLQGSGSVESDFTALTLTLNNNLNTESVIGTLGARYVNTGNLAVTATATGVLNSAVLGRAIRENRTMTMDFALFNSEGGVVVDIPSMTVGGGGKDFTPNQSVRLNVTMTAFRDPEFETSISFSHFPVLPQE